MMCSSYCKRLTDMMRMIGVSAVRAKAADIRADVECYLLVAGESE
jgi:hypothetical protein